MTAIELKTGKPLIQDDIGLNAEALEEWIEWRRSLGKAMTDLAVKKCRNKLLKYSLEHQQFLVDHAIEMEWKGLYHVDMPKKREDSTRMRTLADDLNDTSWAK